MGLKEAGLRGSLRSVSTGVGIPDSAIHHYDATGLSANDGDPISSWPDLVGDSDLSGSDPTYRSSGINGEPAVEFDGIDDMLTGSNDLHSQPLTVFTVVDFTGSTSDRHTVFSSDDSDNRTQIWWEQDSGWSLFAGTAINATTENPNRTILSGVFDETNSLLRSDGNEELSGDAGQHSLANIRLGEDGGIGNYYEGLIGEVVVCDGRLSTSEIEDEEQRLADKWGVTL